jgi:hypothetical protein
MVEVCIYRNLKDIIVYKKYLKCIFFVHVIFSNARLGIFTYLFRDSYLIFFQNKGDKKSHTYMNNIVSHNNNKIIISTNLNANNIRFRGVKLSIIDLTRFEPDPARQDTTRR